jgi:UTP---glucose-1-phosphate uridylyltransferase
MTRIHTNSISFKLRQQIDQLRSLLNRLEKENTLLGKSTILKALPSVQSYLQQEGLVQQLYPELTAENQYIIESIIAIGQAPIVFNAQNVKDNGLTLFNQLLELLSTLEGFYAYMGGIVGYHLTMLTLILKQIHGVEKTPHQIHYIYPPGINLEKNETKMQLAIRQGIESIKQIGEIYPVGGAGDRLNLTDPHTGAPLPAALLPFLGRTLIEGLIRDTQAIEYLAFKLFGEQWITPIAFMTSVEKNNHAHILNICQMNRWFGRPIESYHFFIQPVVPVITIEGNWSLVDPFVLNLKPSGHGVIWRLAEEQGIFDWLASQERRQCLVRQINNPVAGTDQSILALLGIGCQQGKAFGFISCERLLNSDEGMDVLVEKELPDGYDYEITNIEYTDLIQKGIQDIPAYPGSPYSLYPANTNVLFADIVAVRSTLKVCAMPGQLINLKLKVPYINSEGVRSFVLGGRLESTMQNIADYIVDHFPKRLSPDECIEQLRTFIIYNKRSKTISTTKKSYQPGQSTISTPEQVYYDILSNHYALLQHCQFELPPWRTIEDYLLDGPSCIFLFHPALGPLYPIIAQKIRRGRLALGAELQLEMAEIDIENLTLKGSLFITSPSPLGIYDDAGVLRYGGESRCSLHDVTVHNEGTISQPIQNYWKNDIIRKECVTILLHEGAEFHAQGVVLKGHKTFEVPAYHSLKLQGSTSGQWTETLSPITKPSWQWNYHFDSENEIQVNITWN